MKKLYLILALIILVGLPAGACFYTNTHNSGAVHARDLGVRPRGKDMAVARLKIANLQSGKSVALTSRELTAWLGSAAQRDTPFRETQLKVNPDRSVEISTLLISRKLAPYAAARGYSADAARQLVEQLGGSETVPLYIKCRPSVTRGHLALTIQEVQVEDVGIPRFILKDKQDAIRQMLQNELQRNNIDYLRVNNGKVVLRLIG